MDGRKAIDGPWLGFETLWIILLLLAIFIMVAAVDADARKDLPPRHEKLMSSSIELYGTKVVPMVRELLTVA